MSRFILLLIVVAALGAAIYAIETQKLPGVGGSNVTAVPVREVTTSERMNPTDKASRYEVAKEITTPDGFINTDGGITIGENVGKNVVLVDFWTYSCINCQRTLPYLTAWHEKYKDKGLVIIGIHTPEFEFEKEYSNVQAAVEQYGVKYPVVLDNDFSTWHAYLNRYWPRKYLVDIDGYIIYDHIGEGGYEETEKKIQEALAERATRLGEQTEIPTDFYAPEEAEAPAAKSPEIYFGASRNFYLGNGAENQTGVQILAFPEGFKANILYLDGSWKFSDEYTENQNADAKIAFRYIAGKVHMVAGNSNGPVTMRVLRDGNPITKENAGSDVQFDEKGVATVIVQEEGLYNLVDEEGGQGEHTLELIIEGPGLKAFTFTFG